MLQRVLEECSGKQWWYATLIPTAVDMYCPHVLQGLIHTVYGVTMLVCTPIVQTCFTDTKEVIFC